MSKFQVSCKGISRKFPGCFKENWRLLQGSFKGFLRIFKWSTRGVSGKFWWCFKEVSRVFEGSLMVFHETLRVFHRNLIGISKDFKGCFRKEIQWTFQGISWMLQVYFKEVLKRFQGSFKGLSRNTQGSFKGVLVVFCWCDHIFKTILIKYKPYMVKFHEDAYWPDNLSLFTISCEHYWGHKKTKLWGNLASIVLSHVGTVLCFAGCPKKLKNMMFLGASILWQKCCFDRCIVL